MGELENGMLVGTYPGHFVGEVTLVHDKMNTALYTNGIDQWVNIGNHRDKCLGNLARCTKGFVMALWLRAPTDPTGRKHFYVNSGGHISKSMGIILHQKNMKLIAYYRTESWEDWRITVEDFADHVWYHVTLTGTSTGLKLYFNGCLSVRQDVSTASVNHEEPWHTDFVFGNSNTVLDGSTSKSAGEMTLDDVLIWDADMNEEDVWEIYTGDIPWYNLQVSGNLTWVIMSPLRCIYQLNGYGLETLVCLRCYATRS